VVTLIKGPYLVFLVLNAEFENLEQDIDTISDSV